MSYKTLILEYLIRKTELYEDEYSEYQDFCRYANADEVELLEQIIRKVKRDLMRQTLRDIMNILSLTKPKR